MLLVLAPSSALPLQILMCFSRHSRGHCLFAKYKKKNPHPKQTTVKCAAKINPHQPGLSAMPSQGRPEGRLQTWEGLGDIKPSHGCCFPTKATSHLEAAGKATGTRLRDVAHSAHGSHAGILPVLTAERGKLRHGAGS